MEAISEELPGQLLGANNALFSLAQLKTNQKSETGISLLAIEEKNNEDSIKTKNTIVANVSLNSKEIVLNPSSILMLSAQFNYQQENLIENLETLTKYINNNGYDWQNCNRCMIYCESAAIKNKLKEYFKSLRIGMSAMLFVPGNLNLITFDCDFTKSKP